VLLLLTGTLLAYFRPEAPANVSPRTLTFAERVSYQRAIEDVYWRHRIWPKERPDPKPSLNAVISQAQLEKKVEDYLLKSQTLEDHWQQPITAEQLQAEMDRMAQHTKQPEVLRELFEALGNDPFVIAECLARPIVAERLVGERSGHCGVEAVVSNARGLAAASASYTLPTISNGPNGCIDDTWTATSLINAPTGRENHTAVWTGSEMIIWGGHGLSGYPSTGGKYNPSTDSWTATSVIDAPDGRGYHTAVWTGSEMIVWGGQISTSYVGTGGRYDPSTDTWTPTSLTDAPDARMHHTAVWTGSEMIVWGGFAGFQNVFNTGRRYNPGTDSCTATNTTGAPSARIQHTAVWTGSQMVVWGGQDLSSNLNTGCRYDPATDSWMPTSTTDAPIGRTYHTAVWTGSEMIIWGGFQTLNTGGRYDPQKDSWIPTSTTDAPQGRFQHTTIWTGSEMIVWGGAGEQRS
jgi:N-acetylneuraminic acid mutarotase